MSAVPPIADLRLPARLAMRRRRWIAGPVLIVAALLGLVIWSQLAGGGNLTVFVVFGRMYASAIHPPAGALLNTATGYDGQFFYVQALDPLLLHDATVHALSAAEAGFRMQRMAYPALAYLLAGGQASAVPFALLAVNVFVLLGLTIAFAIYFARRGWSAFWALPLALMPGMLLPVLRDLSDPLATAALVAGIVWWQNGSRWPAALALTVAVLTREVMIVAVVGVAAEAAVRDWRAWRLSCGVRLMAGRVWPVIALPAAAFVAWQAYVVIRNGGLPGDANLGLPFANLIQEANWSLAGRPPLYAAWDIAYLLLILAAIGVAFLSAWRQLTVTSAAAAAIAIGVLVPAFGDIWSDTRLSAALFALLLIDGLQRRARPALIISAAAASMTALLPLGLANLS
ncbi:MAG: hypothetical protein ACRDNK_04885 [Solirubrobacteraceae bacterium]